MIERCRRIARWSGALAWWLVLASCGWLAGLPWGVSPARGEEAPREQGEIAFVPTPQESAVPERFRLGAHRFPWQAEHIAQTPRMDVWNVTFPSPVTTPVTVNNTVHAEYYRARQPGRRPAVIVLHILGGDFELSRLFCNALAQYGVHALFVKMPYYGPRRDPTVARRMVSTDPHETVAGLTQAVLDIRRATAWLAARSEVDDQRLGIFGISLGGITSSLAAAVEPRIHNVCLLLAGGDIGRVSWEAADLVKVRQKWLDKGRSREEFIRTLTLVDPVTYAAGARGKRILMLNADHDEVIPRDCTLALWEALGRPEIRWYAGGHYSVIVHLPRALLTVPHFFASDEVLAGAR